MNLFDLSLRLSGFNIDAARKKIEQIQAIPDSKYRAYLHENRSEIVKYHLNNTPFYKKLATENSTWENLPVLTKANLQQPLNDRLAKDFTSKNVYVGKTSGSSGHPFLFAKDKWSHALSWASFYSAYAKAGIDLSNDYQARFYGLATGGNSRYKERFKDFISGRYRLPIFDLSEAKMTAFLAIFKKKKFTYIYGYTSSIVLFAKFLAQKNIVLKEICPTLKLCIVTSEMLFSEDRIIVEKQFGIPLRNEYGASETGLIAFENNEDELQIDSKLLYVEILDENDKIVPAETEGRVVITSLYNKAHPIIRYDIGDLGVLSQDSSAKKMILKKLTGRKSDFAVLPSGKVVPGLAFYYVTKKIIDNDSSVKEFVITQTQINAFLIEYVSNFEMDQNLVKKIKEELAAYLEPNLDVLLIRKDVIARSKSGKLKQFTSHVIA